MSLVEAGLTGAEIAAQLGKTRSAIMGRCHRCGLILPLDDRKKALRPKRAEGRTIRFPTDHPMRRPHPKGARVFSDDQIAIAIAAHLAGASRPKASRMIGAGHQALSQWEKKPELMEKGRALYEIARADATQRATVRRDREASEAEERRLTIERTNWPILGRMPERHRAMMERRVAGETLQKVGDAFGVTRERVRQIEVKWRANGLLVPNSAPLSVVLIAKYGGAPKHPKPPGYKREYRMTEADRGRRADWMRELSRWRWEVRP